ncbi:2EXR domain-containing protein [Madurella fahalii]|uniref:2EXR domain-containing protein n=1 Tax=Madurella fahalii TaxID=1157608 RepID=A0ABQ0G8J2_9PEZI
MPREHPPTFLTLPLELRLEIYKHLLTLPPPPSRKDHPTTYRCSLAASCPTAHPAAKLYPQILRVNSQVNAEATPLLYTHNTFTLTKFNLPTIFMPWVVYPPVTTPRLAALIRRWHLRLRMDPPAAAQRSPQSDSDSRSSPSPSPSPEPPAPQPLDIPATFSHAETITLDLWRGTSGFLFGVGADVLRPFEQVRGVRHVRVEEMVYGFERYVSWLAGMMKSREGERVGEEYVPVDDAEGKRLVGWR